MFANTHGGENSANKEQFVFNDRLTSFHRFYLLNVLTMVVVAAAAAACSSIFDNVFITYLSCSSPVGNQLKILMNVKQNFVPTIVPTLPE